MAANALTLNDTAVPMLDLLPSKRSNQSNTLALYKNRLHAKRQHVQQQSIHIEQSNLISKASGTVPLV